MGEISEAMVDGLMCQFCGTYFVKEHGYPVVCKTCWKDLSKKEKQDYQKATEKEL